jgi:hypothetical protein
MCQVQTFVRLSCGTFIYASVMHEPYLLCVMHVLVDVLLFPTLL